LIAAHARTERDVLQEDIRMSIPVNLYVDRMSPEQPVRVADVYAVTQERAPSYKEAAAKIGLTTREYAEFRQALNDGGAIYVRLPRHIDAMAGVHRRTGHVYALRNVVVPSGTMGWQVNLADGTTVLIPRVCGNLSMNRGHAIAQRRHPVAIVARQPKAVRAAIYVAPKPAIIAATPVTFVAPEAAAPAAGAVPVIAAAAGHSGLPFLGLLFPVLTSLTENQPTTTPPAPPEVAPCSLGSNAAGVCRN
jgi:hypothetical protein